MYKKLISIVLTLALLVTPTVALADSQTAAAPPVDTLTDLGIQDGAESRAAVSGIIDGGIYYIKNVYSGKYLNVHYGTDANGTNVYQWTKDNSTEQKFKIVYNASADAYKIYAMCSSSGTNRVLDVARNGSALAAGQNVAIWTPVDNTAQYMRFLFTGEDDTFMIYMKGNSNLVLAAYGTSNGTGSGKSSTSAGNVFIDTMDYYDDSQAWKLEYISGGSSSGGGGTTNVYRNMNWSYMFRSGRLAEPYYGFEAGLDYTVGDEHTGIDIYAPVGTPVYSTTSGTVEERGTSSHKSYSSMGNFVVIATDSVIENKHLWTRYLHFDSAPLVADGQTVYASTLLGYVGNTGQSYGEHLHFDVNKLETWDGPTMRANGMAGVINPELFWEGDRIAWQGN